MLARQGCYKHMHASFIFFASLIACHHRVPCNSVWQLAHIVIHQPSKREHPWRLITVYAMLFTSIIFECDVDSAARLHTATTKQLVGGGPRNIGLDLDPSTTIHVYFSSSHRCHRRSWCPRRA